MIGALRRQKQNHQIDGLIVQRLEIDGLVKACENADDLVQRRQLAVRDGNPISNTRRTQPLALQDDIEYLALGKSRDFRSLGREFLQQLLLGAAFLRRRLDKA